MTDWDWVTRVIMYDEWYIYFPSFCGFAGDKKQTAFNVRKDTMPKSEYLKIFIISNSF